jgi:hypothetical protein
MGSLDGMAEIGHHPRVRSIRRSGYRQREATMAKKRAKAAAGRCEPLRQELAVIANERRQIQKKLQDAPDLPPMVLRQLRKRLAMLEALDPEVRRVLRQCTAIK